MRLWKIIYWLVVLMTMLLLMNCAVPLSVFPNIPDLGFETVQDVMTWMGQAIRYVSDEVHYPQLEYWQSPDQTYVWRAGDCEDFAILAMYFIYRDVGIEPAMAVGTWTDPDTGVETGHAWVFVEGEWWEPRLSKNVTSDPVYRLQYMVSYEDAIRRSTTTHRSVVSTMRGE